MQKILDFVNGKKTIIGTTLLIGSAVIDQVLGGIWGLKGEQFSAVSQTCDWFGMALGGTGLAHKFAKYKATEKKLVEEASNG